MCYLVTNGLDVEIIANGYDEAYELCDEMNEGMIEGPAFYVQFKRL